MNPATKKYPRPNLPLLRNRFKQRNERQIVKHLVSAKTNWLRPPCSKKSRSVGGSHHSPVHTQNTPTGAPPSRGACHQNGKVNVTYRSSSIHVFLFLLFFFLKAARLKCHCETKMLLPPNPHRNLVRQRTRRRLTTSHTANHTGR